VATESDWEVFCRRVIERVDLLEDPRFRSPELRRQNRTALEESIEGIFRQRPHDAWLRRLADARLPHGRVNGIAEVLAHPQVSARHFVREVESPVGPIPVVGSPLRLSDSGQPSGRIPALGEDTEPLLRELGYVDADVARLRGDSVI
jgi:itaconate CoA-transferase